MIERRVFGKEIKSAVIIGAGGGANYYIAKFLLGMGVGLTCFDISRNKNMLDLEKLGAKTIYENPDDFSFPEADLVVYTQALPQKLIEELLEKNEAAKVFSAGQYYNKIVSAYERGEFGDNKRALTSIKASNIAPLFGLDLGKTLLIGVTGSKGKTTTSFMLYEVLRHLGVKTSVISTIGCRVLDEQIETGLHTSTPSAQELAELFELMLKKGSEVIVLETSSHAIATGRVAGLRYDFGVVTNLQAEHLDFHKDLDEVIEVKKRLVTELLKEGGGAILNVDDANVERVVLPEAKKRAGQVYAVSMEKRAKVEGEIGCLIENLVEKSASIEFGLKVGAEDRGNKYKVGYPGRFNAYNVTPAIIVARNLSFKPAKIVAAVEKIETISGRNELIQSKPFGVVLDFAHTPESLEEIFGAYKRQLGEKNKLIVVFGAAGKRDSLKRSRMGEAAAQFADITVLTAEDPRTEDLAQINREIREGWEAYVKKNNLKGKREIIEFNDASLKEKVRRQAIEKAVGLAQAGDMVVCAGKGHEKSLCFGFEERSWDEKQEINQALARLATKNK